jgi:hypothetical protein
MAVSGSNSERHHFPAGTCGNSVGKPRQKEVMGEIVGFFCWALAVTLPCGF